MIELVKNRHRSLLLNSKVPFLDRLAMDAGSVQRSVACAVMVSSGILVKSMRRLREEVIAVGVFCVKHDSFTPARDVSSIAKLFEEGRE